MAQDLKTFKSFKQRVREGATLRIFSLGRIVHPMLVEMFAQAGGYDGFWMDSEHSAPTPDQLYSVGLAARARSRQRGD